MQKLLPGPGSISYASPRPDLGYVLPSFSYPVEPTGPLFPVDWGLFFIGRIGAWPCFPRSSLHTLHLLDRWRTAGLGIARG
jgi:hypothetical protein